MGDRNSENDDDESKGNNALDILLDLPVMAYLQVGEVLMGLTPKEWDRIIHKVKCFWWEGSLLLQVWMMGKYG